MANKGKRMLFEEDYEYLQDLVENHPDPSAEWGGGSGGDVNIEAGTGITITTESDDTKVISLDTTPSTFEVTASTGTTLEVENANPLYKDAKLQMTSAGSTRLEGATIDIEGNNVYLHSDNAPYYVNNTTHEYKTLATTDQLFSGDYDDLYNKPTIPDAVSGTNDGTNWTSLTIGEDTYGLASGGTTYTAGTGIDITGSTISVDTSTVAMKTDLPDITHMVTDNTNQDITGVKTFKGEDRIVLQGTTASQKPGFAVLDYNDDKRGFLELRPGSGDKTMVLGVYNKNNYTDTSTYRVGFREYNQNYSNYTYSTLMPKGSDKYTTFGSGNMNMVLGVNGQKADDSGNVSLSIPDTSNMVTTNTTQTITGLKYFTNTINVSNNSSKSVAVNPNSVYIKDNNTHTNSTLNENGLVVHFTNLERPDNEETAYKRDTIQKVSLNNFTITQADTAGGTTKTYTFDKNKEGTVAVTSDIPTATSDLTNDSGFITGITSSDVTTALGYTPGTSNFSGSYNDLTNKPDLSIYAQSANLATVATTGSYNDLTDKPVIPQPTVLYNVPNGEEGVNPITMSDSFANYQYVDIQYRCYDNAYEVKSVRIYDPDGKHVYLDWDVLVNGNVYAKKSIYELSGNTMTVKNGSDMQVYYSNGSTMGTQATATTDYQHQIKITKVVGWKDSRLA